MTFPQIVISLIVLPGSRPRRAYTSGSRAPPAPWLSPAVTATGTPIVPRPAWTAHAPHHRDMVSGPLTDGCYFFLKPKCGERPMQIVCPSCATSYRIDHTSVGKTGRSVRCARCRTVWFATATTEASPTLTPATVAAGAPAAPERDDLSADMTSGPAGEDRVAVALDEAADGPRAAPAPESGLAADAAVDADSAVAIVDSPPLAPSEPDPAANTIEPVDIESVALRRTLKARRRRISLPRPGMRSLLVALVTANVALVVWRTDVVRFAPQTAPLYAAIGLPVNVRGLVFADVTTEIRSSEGVRSLLLVRGHDREHGTTQRRGAAPAFCGPRREGRRDLYLDRGADPERAGAGRDAGIRVEACVAAARDQGCAGAVLLASGPQYRHRVRPPWQTSWLQTTRTRSAA